MAADQKQQAAAEALRTLLHGGGAAVRAAIHHEDPAVRRAAAKRLLTGTPIGDPDDAAAQRKTEAVQRLADYQASSLGRGPSWSPQRNNPSDYAQAADTIAAATGIQVGYDNTGETL